MRQVGDLDAQQVVHVAGHGVALDHLGPELDIAGKVAHGRMAGAAVLVQADVDVGQQAQPDFLGVDQRHVFLDEALLFQPPHPAQAGAGRQGNAVGQLLVAQAAVALQFGQNPYICPIQLYVRHFQPHIFYLGQYYCSTLPLPRHVCNCLPAFPPYNLHPRLERQVASTTTQGSRLMSSAFQPWDNPMGTAGFEFIEYAAPDPAALRKVFELLGFKAIAKHRHKDVTLYRQGGVNFLINAEPDSFAQRFARLHGPSICAIGFRVQDAAAAYKRALELGAWGFDSHSGPMELNIPAIKGIGDSLIYLVDRWTGKEGHGGIGDISIYDVDFVPVDPQNAQADLNHRGAGLTLVDHLTHNVHKGRMAEWSEFYERLPRP
ncbi:4-hydroxyphenylpyruvate dioxygenase [Beauveria bassiana D1-5]|uniref:4-hydroxyphenylpyruvate dioxygenase n=1 Tax=Beauveria bassiana D1-5 TaxID=1245745 RepID=A0A0A2V8J1_BEABA|nr:4-hydroxyphenylpyruvate dioxygenase [Beauveria bassiana D1-5]